MYNSFRVKNFRCFKDLQLNDLGRVNLIAGKNNTGKTALLEAMYLLSEPLSAQVLFDLQKVRGLAPPNRDLRTYWGQFFFNMNSTVPIQVESKSKSVHREVKITELLNNAENQELFRDYIRDELDHLTSRTDLIKHIENITAALELVLTDEDSQRTCFLYSNGRSNFTFRKDVEPLAFFVPVQGRAKEQTIAAQFSALELQGKLSDVIKTFEIFEPRLKDLRLLSPHGETMLWATINGIQVPQRLMGEGVNRVTELMLHILLNPESYLFIDEIENGIHHSVQKDVWKAIGQVARELDIQVFATTHSLEMIRAAYEAFSESGNLGEFRYHRLDRGAKGEIDAVTYNERGLDAVATFDFDFEVRG